MPEVEDALRAVSGVALTGLPRAGRAQSASVQRQVALRLAHVAVAGPLPALGFNSDPGILLAAAPGRLDDPVLRAARGAAANAVPRPSHGIWLRGFAGVGAHDIDRQTRADSDHLGLVGGYDHRFTATLTAGLFASYTDSELNQPRPQASSSVRAWQLGAYGRLQHASWHVDGLFGYGGSSTDTSRRLLFGETLRHATASIDGETLSTYLRAAYTFDTRLVLQSCLAPGLTRQSQDGAPRRGAGVLGLELDAHDVDSART